MTKKIFVCSAIAATVLFTGCASKDAGVANKATKAPAPVATETHVAPAPAPVAVNPIEEAQGKIKTVLFDFDKFNIRTDMQPIAEENAKVVGDKSVESAKIKLEGNADERGTDEYNYALGLKRAESVKSAYESKGVSASRISTVSLGEGNPVCKESTEECWAKNRRVDTKLN